MSRRVWLVLLVVVAVLVVAPHLPQWGPATIAWLHAVDLAAVGHDLLAGCQRVGGMGQAAIVWALAHPQLTAGVGGAATLLLVGLVVRRSRGRRVASPRRPGSISVMPAEPIARPARTPTPAAAPVAPPPAPAPAVVAPVAPREPRRRRPGAGRGIAVRRLSAAGHSTAEIARATRVGQDAVRLVLHREARG